MKKLSEYNFFDYLNICELMEIKGGDLHSSILSFSEYEAACESLMCQKKACKTEAGGTCLSNMCATKSCKRNE